MCLCAASTVVQSWRGNGGAVEYLSRVSGEVGSSGGTSVLAECSGDRSAGVVAPLFSSFVGRPWESRYPELLDKYYATVASVGGTWSGSGVLQSVGVAVVGSDGRSGDTQRVGIGKSADDTSRGGLRRLACSQTFGDGAGSSSGTADASAVVGSDVGGAVVSGGSSAGVDSDSKGKYVLPQRRGDGETATVAKGRNYERNQRARRRRRARVAVSQESAAQGNNGGVGVAGSGSDVDGAVELWNGRPKTALRVTLERRWEVENRLKTAEAERKLQLLESQDLDQLRERQRTKLVRDTEVNRVQVEQAFGRLASTGNVPGFAQTVVSGFESVPGLTDGSSNGVRSNSITPNSSVSEAEVRSMQKRNLDLQATVARLEKENRDLAAGGYSGGYDDFDAFSSHPSIPDKTPEERAYYDEFVRAIQRGDALPEKPIGVR